MRLITKFRRFILLLCCSLILMILPHTTVFAETTDPNCSITLGTWQTVAPVPNNHIEGASAATNDELYIFTGFVQEVAGVLQPTSAVDIYNPASNTWRSGSPSPFIGSHVQSARDGDFIYLVGGFVGADPGAPTNAVWQYNTQLDNWTPLPNLPQPRASGGVAIHNSYLHYISGLDASRTADQPDHWILDLRNPISWVPLANLPQPRNHFQAVQIDQYIYAAGGQFGHDGGPVDLALLHAFDTETGIWEQRANTFGSPRSHAEPATFVLFDRIIMVGGRDVGGGQDTMDSIIMYNPQTDTWSQLGTIPTSLIGATANVINNQMIVTAGGTAYNVGQQQTWIADIISNCVTVPYEVNRGAINNIDLTYTGALNANRAGRIGDLITWTVNVVNNGNVTEYFNLDVNLPDIVALRSVNISGASYTQNGQIITVDVPPMNPSDEFSFSITTRLTGVSLEGVISSLAQIQTRDNRAIAEVRLLPPVTALPQTGETPWERVPLLAGLIAIIAVLGMITSHKIIASRQVD